VRRLAPALAAAALAGCGGAPAPPGIVLVTLDTFRADHLGCAGNPAVRTPHLDRLARRGTMWPDAVTAIPLTTPSHASILTGTSPRSHGVLRNRMRLRGESPVLAGRLRDAGFRTGAVVSVRVVLGPEMELDRGFESYEVVEPPTLPASGQGALTVARALGWLRERGGPLSFLWVHFFDPHLPYAPPAPWPRIYGAPDEGPDVLTGTPAAELDAAAVRALRARYAGEVSFVDACVGRMARALDARDDRAGTVLVVTADHGEGLGEHRSYFGHDVLLYETTLRVPLIVTPFGRDATRRAPPAGLAPEPARTTDVAPTIAGIAGLPPDPAAEGRDLLRDPAREGDDRMLVAETYPEPERSEPLYAMRADPAKVIWRPRERRHEYYDLARDPGERHDLGDAAPEEMRMLAADLEIDLRTRPPGAARTIDDERGGAGDHVRRALESLGYLGGGGGD